jgi:hypothetical protein
MNRPATPRRAPPTAGRVLGQMVALALGVAAFPLSAAAYVRTTTETGAAMRWANPTVPVLVYLGAPPRSVTRDQVVNAVLAAAKTWSSSSLSCTGLSLVVSSTEEADGAAADDRINRITFRREQWRREPCRPDKPEDCTVYDRQALAITSVLAVRRTGEIVDSDMELNAVDKVWSDVAATLPGNRSGEVFDLQNTLTHELGHLIGLDHNCTDAATRGVPLNHLGQLAPACAQASAELQAATMFNQAGSGDIGKRDLSEDDMKAACDVYPTGQGIVDLDSSDDDQGGGCSVPRPHALGGSRSRLSWVGPLLAGLGLGLTLARRRRRRG